MENEEPEIIEIPEIKDERSEYCWTGSENFLHVLFLLMASGVLLMSVVMRYESGQVFLMSGLNQPLPPMCSSQILFGIDCPGCGLTRAFISISHGQWGQAWRLNRASFVVYAFVAAQLPWHLMQLWRSRQRLKPIESNLVYLIPITLVMIMMINWLIRLPSLLG